MPMPRYLASSLTFNVLQFVIIKSLLSIAFKSIICYNEFNIYSDYTSKVSTLGGICMLQKNKVELTNDERMEYPKIPFKIIFETFNFTDYNKNVRDIKFDNTTNTTINDAAVISAKPDIKNEHKESTLFLDTRKRVEDTNKFFVNLLNLRVNLSDELFCEFSDIHSLLNIRFDFRNKLESKNISKKDIKAIIKWCVKNGYPYPAENESLNYYKSGNTSHLDNKIEYNLRNTLIKPNVEYYFSVWDFLVQLHILCLAFTIMSETLIPNYDMDRSLKSRYLRYIKDYNEIERLDILREIFFKAKMKAVPDFMNINNESLLINRKTIDYESIVFYAENAFDLALYISYINIKSGYNSIKMCPCCQKYFIPERPNQKYCHNGKNEISKNGTCYSQLMYKRRKTRENKE